MNNFIPSPDGVSKTDDIYHVHLNETEYDICDRTAPLFGCNHKRGYIDKATDPFRTVRVGLFGEMAVAKIFGLEIDLQPKAHDNCDFLLPGNWRLDVKTMSKETWWKRRSWSILAVADDGHRHILKSNYFIFAGVTSEYRAPFEGSKIPPLPRHVGVTVVGWLPFAEVVKRPMVTVWRGDESHCNYEFFEGDFYPLDTLTVLTPRLDFVKNCV